MTRAFGVALAGLSLPRQQGAVPSSPTAEQVDEETRAGMFRTARTFMDTFNVPALSVAISRNGQLVYQQALGHADRQEGTAANPSSVFRIAGATKPITSVTIFSLIEKGQLNLGDKVFGPSGVLGTKFGSQPYRRYVTDITVDHLLTHTCGGWPSDNTDPMFRFPAMNHAELISWTLDHLTLAYPPGQHWAYSNFGYCVLGRVIEQVTKRSYAEYVQENTLSPCGIADMAIAQNTQRQRRPDEVVYYGRSSENPYGINVVRMDADGGWLAPPSDLVLFLDHVDGVGTASRLLKPDTVRTMTTPAPAYPEDVAAKYARGWRVSENGNGNWWHNGSLPGTSTIMVRTTTGLHWAALTNTRSQPSDKIDGALDSMMWEMVRQVPSWQA